METNITYTDYLNNTHTAHSLYENLNRIPNWYWSHRPGGKEILLAHLDVGSVECLEIVFDAIEYINEKISDWASD